MWEHHSGIQPKVKTEATSEVEQLDAGKQLNPSARSRRDFMSQYFMVCQEC